jgi:uncharacterized protein
VSDFLRHRASVPDYYDVARRPKQLWKTDSNHTGGYDAAPLEYERRVVRFFDRSLSVTE